MWSLLRLFAAFLWFLLMLGFTVVLTAGGRRRGPVRWVLQRFGRGVLWILGARPRVEGLQHIPAEGGFVLAANHESDLDGVMLVGYVPRAMHVVAKAELFRIPGLGHGFRMLDFIEVDRARKGQAHRPIGAGARRVKEGAAALIFPEGRRSRDGHLGVFKRGAAVMAQEAGVPLVPVGIAGTWQVFPPGSRVVRPGPVGFVVGDPLRVAPDADPSEVTVELQDRVAALRARARAQLGLTDEVLPG